MVFNRFGKMIFTVLALSLLFFYGSALAGPYTENSVYYTSSKIKAWATGYLNYLPSDPLDESLYGTYAQYAGVYKTFQTPQYATGQADNKIVTLGDLYQEQIDAGAACGEITLTFDLPIANGDGIDFAVYENGFWNTSVSPYGMFAELAYVYVSTDGENWALFPGISLTEGLVGAYGCIEPTDVYNLAGNYARYTGTGFDLDDLQDHELVLSGLVDLNEINYVKVVDIPGSGDYLDSQGYPIYDAWVTWGSGGFDLDAVAVLNVKYPDGDLSEDGTVDRVDAIIIRSAIGSSQGDDAYAEEADYDEDGDVDFADYRQWYKYYKAFISEN